MDLTEDELKPGLILGRYELLAPVAKGGMAQVWVARLTGTRGFTKTVAIKTMLPNVSDDPQFEEMFLDEASLASRVRHPNACEIMDLGEDAGILYLVMEWIEGEPLSVLMKQAARQKGIPLPLAVRIVMHACAGLHAAHELKDDDGNILGLVHRDVSPQNILVSYDGVVKVVDFGVAKATGRVSAETSAGQIKGKVPYMSPEQASGGDIDRRTDIFAMGILLYMMTTGKHPFRKDNEAQTLLAICSDAPVVPPSAFMAEYPPELEEVLLKVLSKSADDRYQTASELLKALDALPSEMRASTDEELGVFIRELLTERMHKRRALIQKAIKAADARAEGRKSFVEFMPDDRSGSQLTPLSGVSRVSSLEGFAVARASPPTELSEPSTSTAATAVPATSPGRAKRVPASAIVGGLALGAGVALGLYLILGAGGPDPRSSRAGAGQESAAEEPAGATTPAAANPPAPPGEVVQVDDLEPAEELEDTEVEVVREIDLDEEASSPKKPKARRAPRPRARRAPGPKPSAKKPPAPNEASAAQPKEGPAPAPEPKPSKPFISPFADPDF